MSNNTRTTREDRPEPEGKLFAITALAMVEVPKNGPVYLWTDIEKKADDGG